MLNRFNTLGTRAAVRSVQSIMPPALPEIQDWLRSSGVHKATLFGSSLYATQLGHPNRINDHDLIIGQTDLRWWKLRERLARTARMEYSTDHPLQPKRLFYTLPSGVKTDVCLSYAPRSPRFMAEHALFGISAIAADVFTKQVWVRPEFEQHMREHVIRPLNTDDTGLILRYADKMSDKFPDFRVDLGSAYRPKNHYA